MRSIGTATVVITLLTLAGCGSDGGDADDVPTITTRPSPSATGTATESEPPTTGATASEPAEVGTSGSPAETSVAPPTSAPPPDDPRGPTTYDEAIARVNEAGLAGTTVFEARFVTPGDDVYCLLDDEVIGPSCELGNGFIADPEVCGADSTDRVGRIETFDGRPRPVCNADTIREPGAKVVRAPAAVVNGDVSCGVERFGVTCVDHRVGVGFFLGKGEYHVFR